MNSPGGSEIPRPASPVLEDYPFRMSDNVRFADLDANQHVNNASFATYFETGRVALTKDPKYGLVSPDLSWVMVRLAIHFRAELRWPGRIDLGLGVTRFGRTSVTYEQAVFSEGECVASAQSVTVLVNDRTRQPTPLTENILRHLLPWRHRGFIEP